MSEEKELPPDSPIKKALRQTSAQFAGIEVGRLADDASPKSESIKVSPPFIALMPDDRKTLRAFLPAIRTSLDLLEAQGTWEAKKSALNDPMKTLGDGLEVLLDKRELNGLEEMETLQAKAAKPNADPGVGRLMNLDTSEVSGPQLMNALALNIVRAQRVIKHQGNTPPEKLHVAATKALTNAARSVVLIKISGGLEESPGNPD